MSQDITTMQVLAAGNTLGTAAGVADDNFVGCTFVRGGAGAYTVLFNTIPPGLTTPRNVVIDFQLLAADPSAIVNTVTKTVDGSGNCTGFTVATGAPTDEAWCFVAYRMPQAK